MNLLESKYTAVITKGEIAFIAFCPELNITSQGKTEQKAFENLKEALELYLEDEDVQKMLKKHPSYQAKIIPISVSV